MRSRLGESSCGRYRQILSYISAPLLQLPPLPTHRGSTSTGLVYIYVCMYMYENSFIIMVCKISQSYTGRLSPNAWPSKEMLENSPFVRAAVQKPYHTYFSTLLKFAPMHLYGLFFFTLAAVVVACAIAAAFPRLFYTDNNSETTPNEDDVSDHDTERNKIYSILRRNAVLVKLCVFSLWPLSFLVGLTLLGSAGAGFQARFLLPILPATAILSSATVYVLQGYCMLIAKPMDSIFSVIVASSVSLFDVLLFIAVIHLCVYGMMFAPLFGDLDLSIIDMISAMHKNPLSSPSSQESWQKILQYLRHFGLDR